MLHKPAKEPFSRLPLPVAPTPQLSFVSIDNRYSHLKTHNIIKNVYVLRSEFYNESHAHPSLTSNLASIPTNRYR